MKKLYIAVAYGIIETYKEFTYSIKQERKSIYIPMGFNITRDKRRNHIAQVEIRQAAARYDSECGEVVTIKLSPEEIEERNKKINVKKKG